MSAGSEVTSKLSKSANTGTLNWKVPWLSIRTSVINLFM